MKLGFWITHVKGIKRWIILGIMGILSIVSGIVGLICNLRYNNSNNIYMISICASVTCLGIFLITLSVKKSLDSIIKFINNEFDNINLNSDEMQSVLHNKKVLLSRPKVVVLGGGTGLSNLLRGMKKFTANITAIVTVGDDGGGSGVLREDLDMIPPGDIRNCILALAHTEPVMEELLQYRFTEGRLKGQSFGNLFLAAMDGISENFMEAVQKVSSVLAVTGKVLPVTMKKIILKAKLENGNIIEGESNIPKEVIEQESPIKKMYMEPNNARGLREAVLAIKEADAIILGPGSLYTSVIPNLLVNDIKKEIHKSSATKIYISNIMTQSGETENYTVSDHIKAIYTHAGKGIIDYVIANNGEIDETLEERYKKEDAILVKVDKEKIESLGVSLIEDNLIKIKEGYIRHDTYKICEIIIEDIMKKELSIEEKKKLQNLYHIENIRKNVN